MTGDLSFGDNNKAIFGAGSDLQIYHDGSNSVIKENGTGNLRVFAENFQLYSNADNATMLRGLHDGAIELYYDGSEKLATTATGIDVTGAAQISYNGVDTYLYYQSASNYTGRKTDGNMWMNVAGGQANVFGISGVEKVRIDSSGNVGIGTSSPDAKLNIVGATGNQLRLSTSETEHYAIGRNDSTGYLDFYASQPSYTGYTFGGVDGERMRIASSGNVGIGDLGNAATLLHIGSTGTPEFRVQDLDAGGGYLSVTHNAGTSTISADPSNSSGSPTLVFKTINTERMRIDSSGSVGIGTSSPNTKLDVVGSTTTSSGIVDTLRLRNTGVAENDGARIQFTAGESTSGAGIGSGGKALNSADLRFYTGGNTERMRLTEIGTLLVGGSVSAGYSPLQIGDPTTASTIIQMLSTPTGYNTIHFGDTTSGGGRYAGFIQYDHTLDAMNFGINQSSKMTLDLSGNLLVGGTSTDPIADNSSSTQINPDGYININRASNASLYVGRSGSDGNAVAFYKGNTNVGTVSLTGSSTAYNTSSDYRLKTDAQPMTGASARVQALKPVNFEWISSGERVDGFLAHEAQAVVPEAVTGTKDAMRDEEYEVTAAVYEDIIIAAVLDEEGNELEAERTEQRLVTEAVMGTRSVPDMQGIDQSKLVPLLTAALQEALNKIDAMEIRLAALENN
jgi:hypothetical protein